MRLCFLIDRGKGKRYQAHTKGFDGEGPQSGSFDLQAVQNLAGLLTIGSTEYQQKSGTCFDVDVIKNAYRTTEMIGSTKDTEQGICPFYIGSEQKETYRFGCWFLPSVELKHITKSNSKCSSKYGSVELPTYYRSVDESHARCRSDGNRNHKVSTQKKTNYAFTLW